MRSGPKPAAWACACALAATAVWLLAGCGGGSTAAPETPSMAGATANGSAAEFNPPRISGMSDEVWAQTRAEEDPAGYKAQFEGESAAGKIGTCMALGAETTAPDPDMEAALTDLLLTMHPGSTAEEWTAFNEYVKEARVEYGLPAIKAELCAAAQADLDASIEVSNTVGASTGNTCDGNTVLCAYGDTGPGGGSVFWSSSEPFDCYEGSTCTALEAAPAGWSGTDSDPLLAWCASDGAASDESLSGATPEEWIAALNPDTFGKGSVNTPLIVANCGSASAAGAAQSYGGGGLTDWYLPSGDELGQFSPQVGTIGGLASGVYWSSSPGWIDMTMASAVNILESNEGSSNLVKTETHGVRPIRAF